MFKLFYLGTAVVGFLFVFLMFLLFLTPLGGE